MAEKIDGTSLDIEVLNKEKLRAVFPECFTEDRLEIDKLLALCGEYISDDFEKYEFKWKGKSECLRLAHKRSTATLRPVPEDSVNWNDTKNIYIEGDNLEVLKLLQKSYFRKVKMIYIDPPYNTGNDFVYKDSFADPLARYKEVTQQTTKSNPETMGRYHTNWLNMMYPRLRLAANLLRDDGVIFISIDDNEVHNLRKICDEVFGEENFVACLVYDKNRKNDAKFFSVGHEYILVYFKSMQVMNDDKVILRMPKEGVDEVKAEFERLKKIHGNDWAKINEELKVLYSLWDKGDSRKPLARFTKVDELGPYRDDGNISWPGGGGPKYEVLHPLTHKPCKIPDAGWRFPSKERMQDEIDAGRVVFGVDETTLPRIRRNLFTSDKQVMRSVHFSYAQNSTLDFNKIFAGLRVFENPKSVDDIKFLVKYVIPQGNNDIILDFFSGSATTAHAVMQLNAEDGGNRQFICVQLPELCDEKSEAYKAGYKNICEIGKERIRRAGKKILESSDSEKSLTDIGFKVFRLDSSNMKLWDDTPIEGIHMEKLIERMDHAIDNLKSGRSETDLVYEILLKMGSPLTAQLAALEISGLTVYSVENHSLLICLQSGITAAHIEQMAAYAPKKIVLAEHALADNSAMSNAHYLLQNKGIELKIV